MKVARRMIALGLTSKIQELVPVGSGGGHCGFERVRRWRKMLGGCRECWLVRRWELEDRTLLGNERLTEVAGNSR
jgi:hypothetical protein